MDVNTKSKGHDKTSGQCEEGLGNEPVAKQKATTMHSVCLHTHIPHSVITILKQYKHR